MKIRCMSQTIRKLHPTRESLGTGEKLEAFGEKLSPKSATKQNSNDRKNDTVFAAITISNRIQAVFVEKDSLW